MNSLIINIKTKTSFSVKTNEVYLPIKFDLSILRGQTIFTSAFNSSLLAPHFPPLTMPGGSDFQGSKYEPKFETKFEPNLSARHGSLPSPPAIRTTQQQNSMASTSDQMSGKVRTKIFNRFIVHDNQNNCHEFCSEINNVYCYYIFVHSKYLYANHLHQNKCTFKSSTKSHRVLLHHPHYADWTQSKTT